MMKQMAKSWDSLIFQNIYHFVYSFLVGWHAWYMVLGEWMGPNFSHCDWKRSCDLLHQDKTWASNSSTQSTSPMLVSFSESASPSCIAPTPISSPWRSTASLPSQSLCGTCLTWWKKLFGWWLLRFGMAHFYSSFCLPSSLTITIRHLPCSWKYPECSFSRFCPSLSLSLQLLISFALPGKSTARPGNWLLKSATTMLWTWVDRTSSHLQYSECNTGVPPSWSYWWWPPSISRTSEGITAVSAFSLIYVPSQGRSDIWFIWCWLPTLLSIQFSIPSLRVIFKRNYLSCSQGR